MTTLGLNWNQYQETMRSNRAREAETERANKAAEKEKHRSNLVNEALQLKTISETIRHNTEDERWNRVRTAFQYAQKNMAELVGSGLLGQEVLNDFVGVVTGLVASYESGTGVEGNMSNNVTKALNSLMGYLGKKSFGEKVVDTVSGVIENAKEDAATRKAFREDKMRQAIEACSVPGVSVTPPKTIFLTQPPGSGKDWQATASTAVVKDFNNQKVRAATDYVKDLQDAIDKMTDDQKKAVKEAANRPLTSEEQAMKDARVYKGKNNPSSYGGVPEGMWNVVPR